MNDFGLKCCGVGQKCKNNSTGETVEKGHFESGLLLRERDVYGADLWRVPGSQYDRRICVIDGR